MTKHLLFYLLFISFLPNWNSLQAQEAFKSKGFLYKHEFPKELITIKGIVVDENDKPLVGTHIFSQYNNRVGTKTGSCGELEIQIPELLVLKFTHVGKQPLEYVVTGPKKSLIIKLYSSVHYLRPFTKTEYINSNIRTFMILHANSLFAGERPIGSFNSFSYFLKNKKYEKALTT